MANTGKDRSLPQDWSAEVLQFDELPLPEPGPGEIRLRGESARTQPCRGDVPQRPIPRDAHRSI